jgi:hypothetical protein
MKRVQYIEIRDDVIPRGLEFQGRLVIVPSSTVDTMNLGKVSGLVSLSQQQMRRKE